jgi:spore coat polysaccharide biosynthesis protein SpsF (cytidylyltransferase family)
VSPLIVIQARMGSTRFPGKVLAPLCGKTVILRVWEACQRAELPTIVAMSRADLQGPLEAYLTYRGIPHYAPRVDEDDVLGRFVAVSELYLCNVMVRVTADCPLVDHRTIRELVDLQRDTKRPYVACANDPDGNDVEVFSHAFLREAHAATPEAFRQHVVGHHWSMTNRAPIQFSGQNLSGIKYSVDTPYDLWVCDGLLHTCGEGAPWQRYVEALKAGANKAVAP